PITISLPARKEAPRRRGRLPLADNPETRPLEKGRSESPRTGSRPLPPLGRRPGDRHSTGLHPWEPAADQGPAAMAREPAYVLAHLLPPRSHPPIRCTPDEPESSQFDS